MWDKNHCGESLSLIVCCLLWETRGNRFLWDKNIQGEKVLFIACPWVYIWTFCWEMLHVTECACLVLIYVISCLIYWETWSKSGCLVLSLFEIFCSRWEENCKRESKISCFPSCGSIDWGPHLVVPIGHSSGAAWPSDCYHGVPLLGVRGLTPKGLPVASHSPLKPWCGWRLADPLVARRDEPWVATWPLLGSQKAPKA